MLLLLGRPFAVLRRPSILRLRVFVSSEHLSVASPVSLNMDVEALLEQLTVEEKVSLTAGKFLQRSAFPQPPLIGDQATDGGTQRPLTALA